MFSAALAMEYPFARFGRWVAFWIDPSPDEITRILFASPFLISARNSRTNRSGAVTVKLSSEVSSSTLLGLMLARIGIGNQGQNTHLVKCLPRVIAHTCVADEIVEPAGNQLGSFLSSGADTLKLRDIEINEKELVFLVLGMELLEPG